MKRRKRKKERKKKKEKYLEKVRVNKFLSFFFMAILRSRSMGKEAWI